MKNLSRTAAVVMALFAGAVFGSMSTGCFALWLGVARADGTVTGTVIDVPCAAKTAQGTFAVQEFPGMTRYDIAANVYTVSPGTSATGTATIAGVTYDHSGLGQLPGNGFLADGSAAVFCQPGQASVQLYVR